MATPRYLARAAPSEGGVRVAVFRSEGGLERQVGEYSRNYGSNFDCFFPFRRNGGATPSTRPTTPSRG
jgi:hypothetical protein